METISRSIPVKRPYKLPLDSDKWGGAHFDGKSGYIQVTKAASINDLTTITVISTIKPENLGENNIGRIFDKARKLLFMDITNKFAFQHTFSTAPFVGTWRISDNSLQFNIIQNIAVTYDNTNVVNNAILYLNGISLAVDELTIPTGTAVLDNFSDLFIGNRTTDDRTFQGTIYDFMYFGKILTQPQIQDLMYGRILPTQFDCRLWHDYRLGHARDLSGNGNHGTLVGNVRFV